MDRERDANFLVELHIDRFRHAQETYGGVFIAYIDENDGVAVEVQEDLDSMLFSMFAEDFEEAKAVEAIIKTVLKSNGISCYKNFEDFERAVLEYYEAG